LSLVLSFVPTFGGVRIVVLINLVGQQTIAILNVAVYRAIFGPSKWPV